MNILVIGSGGREHALCWKIRQSPKLGKLFCAPGNGGIEQVATCVPILTHETDKLLEFCAHARIDLVIIGPEEPLVNGLTDQLQAAGVKVFGPSAKAAQIEGSKAFTKALCTKYGIPTAAYGEFTDVGAAKEYIRKQGAPIVVKADGLAAGKGVVVATSVEEAEEAVDAIMGGRFGAAGFKLVIEECLTGPEVSFFALCDGTRAVEFGSAQDHKRAYDNDEGPNTGGMGTFSPSPLMSPALVREVMETIIVPAVTGLARDGIPFTGVMFAGLMLTPTGPKLLEFNARFGDPETQVLMARLSSDIVPLLMACAEGNVLGQAATLADHAAVCVVMAANGYPGDVVKGTHIRNLAQAGTNGTTIFHAGTRKENDEFLAMGGRVLGVTATGPTISAARASAYEAVDAIDWPEGFCRRDIALSAIQ